MIIYSTSLFEIYTILLPVIPSLTQLDMFLHGGETYKRVYNVSHIRITGVFLAATAMHAAFALIRASCYRELGRAFTYELAVRKDHRLVTTGPYSVVRHPSYTAIFMHFPAALMSQMGPGSWWYESGWWSTGVGIAAGVFWSFLMVVFCMLFLKRGWNEDKTMQGEFGEKWDEWARKTPYRYLPYVM